MSLWRKRRLDIQQAGKKLEAAERAVVDLAARRSRLEAEIELYLVQRDQGGKHGRGG